MANGDQLEREARLPEVSQALASAASPEERELLLGVAPVLFLEMPRKVALELPVPAVAARLLLHARFVALEMPAAHQLYKGLPGIHVSVRNPGEQEARALGGGEGLPLESTIVQTHTADRPFIFRSLKNYLQKQGLRVFSTMHPVLSVRRRWERVVSVAGPLEEGSKESYCFFQIEPVESRERLRRIEHEIVALLKAVFLAIDDFEDIVRACRSLGARLRGRGKDGGDLASARAFLEWLVEDNYVFEFSVGGSAL